MSNVTWIIGNGFDLCMGLKTKYIDFYKVYTNIETNHSHIRSFRQEILKDELHGWKNWSDFELNMGKASKKFGGETPAEDFSSCFSDFIDNFYSYLRDEYARIQWEEVTKEKLDNFRESINHIAEKSREYIKGLPIGSKITHNFLQLNYTNTFDELLKLSQINCFEKNLHIHGKLGGYPTIGVDNETQIENKIIRESKGVKTFFVKQSYLESNPEVSMLKKDALSVINDSNMICVFGASIGDTDKFWWEKIGEWIKSSNDKNIIIFDACRKTEEKDNSVIITQNNKDIDVKRDEIIDRFIRFSGLEEKIIKNRMIVELNNPIMFKFELPLKKQHESELETVGA